jgi:hypothetical protein
MKASYCGEPKVRERVPSVQTKVGATLLTAMPCCGQFGG